VATIVSLMELVSAEPTRREAAVGPREP
jgi:hypothetical protein